MWRVSRVNVGVGRRTPSHAVEVLAEIACSVQKAYPDDRGAQIRGALEVVAREDPEPAGILREGARDPEFRGEVRDRGGQRRLPGALATALFSMVPPRPAEVGLQVLSVAAHAGDERDVAC